MVVTDYCCSSQFITSFVPISLSLSISVYLVPTPTQVHHHQECCLHFRTNGLVPNMKISGNRAKHWGIKTINVVRRTEQVEELRLLGADEVICSTTEGETSENHMLMIV